MAAARARLPALAGLAVLVAAAGTAQAAPMMDYYGIISCADGQTGNGCAANGGGGSSTPARLFGFNTGDSTATFFGDLTLGGSGVDADALAYTSVFGGTLFAFALNHSGGSTSSQLMSIDIAGLTPGGSTVAGTAIAPSEGGLDARGATFAPDSPVMVVLDSNGDSTNALLGGLVIADTGSGFTVASGSTIGQLDRPVGTATDIAFDNNGDLILTTNVPSSSNDPWGFYRVNEPAPGGTTFTTDLLTRDTNQPLQAYAGLAISSTGVYGLDVNGDDDIYSFDPALPGPNLVGHRTLEIADIFGSFNAGRGDLTSTLPLATVPEPGALALMGLGLLSLGALRRRRTG